MPIQPIPVAPPQVQRAVVTFERPYEHEETHALVALVNDATELIRVRGEAAFAELAIAGSRWRHDDTYIFVLDPDGNMLVHPDPTMEGQNQLELADVNGKPIIRGLIGAAMASPSKPGGWFHYQWPVPGGLFPRWKSTYVRLVQAPSGKTFVVGSGMYNERMERAFVVDAVTNAVELLEARGPAAFPLLRDPKGPYIAKDAYVFVMDLDGIELVNPAFPSLEGQNIREFKDTHRRPVIREMIELVQTRGSGWIDYMWPKPGDSVSTQKSAYVCRAQLGAKPVVVGCGVYLAEAPVEARPAPTMTATELVALVREGAALLELQGEHAYAAFRTRGSQWFHDGTYFFVLRLDGTMCFHAADPAREGRRDRGVDVLGRPFRKMIRDVATSKRGEGWVHYMFPEPGNVFPAWKSTFAKRVTLPSGEPRVLCCGIYNMHLDETLIEDVVHRAATLVAERGREAFAQLRDRTGPFVFMDTYVFVQTPDGTELVNAAQPSLEGRNLMALRDLTGTAVVADEIAAAMRDGSAWLDCYWFKPGDNAPARKRTFVQQVQAGAETFIVGSGIYVT